MAGSLRNGGPDDMVWYGVSGNRMKLIRDIQLEYCDVCGWCVNADERGWMCSAEACAVNIKTYYSLTWTSPRSCQTSAATWRLPLTVFVNTTCRVLRSSSFFIKFFTFSMLSLVVWDWPLTWLTNHRPSVLWHCWLGHLTRKVVPEMTYNVSSGTLNPTMLYFSF